MFTILFCVAVDVTIWYNARVRTLRPAVKPASTALLTFLTTTNLIDQLSNSFAKLTLKFINNSSKHKREKRMEV